MLHFFVLLISFITLIQFKIRKLTFKMQLFTTIVRCLFHFLKLY
ncbi:hypothetical protein FM106_01870 [Brachybacterium faecium]|nr:hypothetical protein FM106_01870 [Brachybacterium faecium]